MNKTEVSYTYTNITYKSIKEILRADLRKSFLHPELPWHALNIEDVITIYNLKEKEIGKEEKKNFLLFLMTEITTILNLIVLK